MSNHLSARPPDPLATVRDAIPRVGPPTRARLRPAVAGPADGRLLQLYRVDVDRVGEQVPYVLLPAYVELISTVPPPSEPDAQPVPVPAPALDDGPHLSYAGQWVLFAACAIGGWILVVRRTARAGTSTGKGETPADGPGGDQEQRRHRARHV